MGLQDSNLIILAARPGVSKTALATNIAQFVAVEKKIPVGIFSLEMSNLELVDRMLVGQAGIDAWKMKTEISSRTTSRSCRRRWVSWPTRRYMLMILPGRQSFR